MIDVSFCFFFKQKTAYDMRISDWSSDVCSSDLQVRGARIGEPVRKTRADVPERPPLRSPFFNETARQPIKFLFAQMIARAREGLFEREDRKSTRLNSSH